jgi:hypothetical protein
MKKLSYPIDILSLEIIDLKRRIEIEKDPLYIISYNIKIESLQYAISLLSNNQN